MSCPAVLHIPSHFRFIPFPALMRLRGRARASLFEHIHACARMQARDADVCCVYAGGEAPFSEARDSVRHRRRRD
jgi:hypothetical protein